MLTTRVSREGPFTLLHRPTGAVRVYANLRDAAVALHALDVERLAGAPLPDWAWLVTNTPPALRYVLWRGVHWKLVDACGEVVTFDDLRPWMPRAVSWVSPVARRGAQRQRYRVDPVPGTGAGRFGFRPYWRQPRIRGVLQQMASHDDAEAPVRAGRGRPLPVTWDDRVRDVQRSWKSQRRTQWKPRA